MPKLYKIIEWDMDNGEVVNELEYQHRDFAEEELKEMIEEAEKHGWECEESASDFGGYVCNKDDMNRHVFIEEVDWK